MGPKLKPSQRRRLDCGLPSLALTLPTDLGARFEPSQLRAPGTVATWLEIGFGGGEHLATQAQARPDVTQLGVEPYVNGVASLVARVEAQALTNVRVIVDDARLVLQALPDASLERVAILFPDPWPKARHHKRRIVNAATMADVARVLRPDGELRLASDSCDYVTWMLATLQREPRLAWTAEHAADWRERPADWPTTRYEQKARTAGRACTFLRYRRIISAPTPSAC